MNKWYKYSHWWSIQTYFDFKCFMLPPFPLFSFSSNLNDACSVPGESHATTKKKKKKKKGFFLIIIFNEKAQFNSQLWLCKPTNARNEKAKTCCEVTETRGFTSQNGVGRINPPETNRWEMLFLRLYGWCTWRGLSPSHLTTGKAESIYQRQTDERHCS